MTIVTKEHVAVAVGGCDNDCHQCKCHPPENEEEKMSKSVSV